MQRTFGVLEAKVRNSSPLRLDTVPAPTERDAGGQVRGKSRFASAAVTSQQRRLAGRQPCVHDELWRFRFNCIKCGQVECDGPLLCVAIRSGVLQLPVQSVALK